MELLQRMGYLNYMVATTIRRIALMLHWATVPKHINVAATQMCIIFFYFLFYTINVMSQDF